MTEQNLWIVDDDRSIRFVLSKALTRAGFGVREFADGESVLQAIASERPCAIVSDIRMPGLSGTELLAQLKARAPEVPVIIMTAFSDLDSAVSAFQGGAFEYLPKPFDLKEAVELIARAAQEGSKHQAESLTQGADLKESGLIGSAPAMQEVFRAIGRLSHSTATVLLTGESGSGKEVVAKAIRDHSPRADAPYVAINMASIPRELLESELYGHEKGAFTGALTRHLGRFEQAKGGTLFLDEIGDMPMDLQASLLRVLSNGYFYRVGGHEPIKADVRVIAATNQNLEQAVREGRFREDLYHRLNVIRLRLPPLRARRDDIPLLAEHFLRYEAQQLGVEPKRLTTEALAQLKEFDYPGNVRQLENFCRWLLVMAPSSEIRPEDLPQEVRLGSGAETSETPSSQDEDWQSALAKHIQTQLQAQEQGVWEQTIDEVEQLLISEALKLTQGRRIEAAQRLGIGRNTLARKIHDES